MELFKRQRWQKRGTQSRRGARRTLKAVEALERRQMFALDISVWGNDAVNSDADTSSYLEVASIYVSDDGEEPEGDPDNVQFSLTGKHADLFAVRTENYFWGETHSLALKPGVNLEKYQDTLLEVEVNVDDPNLAGSPDASDLFFLEVRPPLPPEVIKVTTLAESGTAEQLVASLLGGGVEVSNVQYVGSQSAAGIFRGGLLAGLGISEGVVLSSGDAAGVTSINLNDSKSTDLGLEGDEDLDELIPGYKTYDATVLEFDINVTDDYFGIQYAFGSEEYNEYVGSNYNDVFAFFVDGENVALVPGALTPIPVSVNNINKESFPLFFRSNSPSEYQGHTPFPFEPDGFTAPLQATVQLAPGKHHLKLAVADAGDSILDSWVFLSGGGVASGIGDLAVTATSSQPIIKIGQQVTYAYTTTNKSSAAAKEVILDSFIPKELAINSVTTSRGIASHVSGVVSAAVDSLPPGGSFTVTVTATATEDGLYTHGTRVQSSFVDVSPSDNIAVAMTMVEPQVPAVYENSGAGQVVAEFPLTDLVQIVTNAESVIELDGPDSASFALGFQDSTCRVTLLENPDFENKSEYAFSLRMATIDQDGPTDIPLNLKIKNVDEVAPTITSSRTATPISENSGAFKEVYRVLATDSGDISAGIRFSLEEEDQGLFVINPNSGLVRLAANPDYELTTSYLFTVIATDYAGNSTSQEITLPVVDLDDIPPVFNSVTSATVTENIGDEQIVYVAQASDVKAIAFSLSGPDPDAGLLEINPDSGEVRLKPNPDYETRAEYSFVVVATNESGNLSKLPVTLYVDNVDDTAPLITSPATASSVEENSQLGVIVYTTKADDSADVSDGVTFSVSGPDGDRVEIDGATGVIQFKESPDFESKSTWQVTVTATDVAGNQASKDITIPIQNLDEVPPVITSADSAGPIPENSDIESPAYKIVATDTGDISEALSYDVSGADSDYFSVDSQSGEVFFRSTPDFEAKNQYSIEVNAVDGAGNTASKLVTVQIGDVDDDAPVFTSPLVANVTLENSGAGQIVYTAVATDSAAVTYTLSGPDTSKLLLDADTGALTLTVDPDYEEKYTFTAIVSAVDENGNTSENTILVPIGNVDEVAPVFTSPLTADAVREGVPKNQTVYVASVDDSADISDGVSFSILPAFDSNSFEIDPGTGVVRLTESPDYEAKQEYSINIQAVDLAGHSVEQTVVIPVADIDDTSPTVAITTNAASLPAGDEATVYFLLSEPAVDFTADDILVSGGTLSAFRGSGVQYQARVTADQEFDGNLSVTVPDRRFSDLAGNKNDGNTVLAPAIDVRWAPELTISTNRERLVGSQKAGIEFAFNKPVADFISTDVTVVGGTLENFRGSGSRYKATFVPTADFEGLATVSVTAGAVFDSDGETNESASLGTPIAVDVKAPQVVIDTDIDRNNYVLKSGENASLTFTLNEAVVGFEKRDVIVRGGTIVDFIKVSDTQYTATFVPRDNWSGDTRIVVGAQRFEDLYGNKNSERVLLPPIRIETRVPKVQVRARPASVGVGQSTNLTFIVAGGDASGDFTADKIQVTAGEITNFRSRRASGRRTVFTAVYTAPTTSAGTETISVPADTFTIGTNPNGNTEGRLDIAIDANRPTIVITADSQNLGEGDVAEITFTLSEPAQRRTFRKNDVQVVGGRLWRLRATGRDGDIYTARFVPLAGFEGIAKVKVVADRFTDRSGLGNEESSLLQMAVDTEVPLAPAAMVLQNDTGVEPDDGYTKDADLVVDEMLIEVGDDVTGKFEFRINGGSWTSVYSPVEGANNVEVRRLDSAGNASVARAIAFTYLTLGPAIDSVLPPPRSNGLPAGLSIDFEVQFDQSVGVVGTGLPYIELSGFTDDTPRRAELVGKLSGSRLRFRYIVQAGDQAPIGVEVVPELQLPAGTGILDRAGNPGEGAGLMFGFPKGLPKVVVNA